jgi:hypothetical protein
MAKASRYEKALARNLAELQKALLLRTTLLGLEKHRYTGKDFTRIVRDALHNDHLSHAIKVLIRAVVRLHSGTCIELTRGELMPTPEKLGTASRSFRPSQTN